MKEIFFLFVKISSDNARLHVLTNNRKHVAMSAYPELHMGHDRCIFQFSISVMEEVQTS